MAVVVFVLCLSELLWCGCADSTVANRLLASNLRRVYRALMPLWSVMLLNSTCAVVATSSFAPPAARLGAFYGIQWQCTPSGELKMNCFAFELRGGNAILEQGQAPFRYAPFTG